MLDEQTLYDKFFEDKAIEMVIESHLVDVDKAEEIAYDLFKTNGLRGFFTEADIDEAVYFLTE